MADALVLGGLHIVLHPVAAHHDDSGYRDDPQGCQRHPSVKGKQAQGRPPTPHDRSLPFSQLPSARHDSIRRRGASPSVPGAPVRIQSISMLLHLILVSFDIRSRSRVRRRQGYTAAQSRSRRRLRSWCSPDGTGRGSGRTDPAPSSAHRCRIL